MFKFLKLIFSFFFILILFDTTLISLNHFGYFNINQWRINDLFQDAPAQQQGYEWKPNAKTMGMWINSHGLRSPEPPPLHQKERIVILGDSIIAGERGPVEATIPGQLESHINWHVINGGLSSTNALQQTFFYENKIAKFKPEIVIWFLSTAHLKNAHFEAEDDTDFSERHQERWIEQIEKNEENEIGHLNFSGKNFLRRHSLVYGHFANIWHQSLVKLNLRPKAQNSQTSKLNQKTLDELGQLKGLGMRIVVPACERMQELSMKYQFKLLLVYPPKRLVFEGRPDPIAENLIPYLAEKFSFLYIDLSPALKIAGADLENPQKYFYRDENHFSKQGSQWVAKYLHDQLKKMGMIP